MDTSPGSRLDHYEIVELIGKGGMGEVYRARDTRLPRETAIKMSAERFSERFAREAQIIASLNHPNISTLYDVGANYLVMELVEGPTLAERIRQGPLSLDEASTIARQVADALDYAHDRGVVHRDLKPGNIKIRPDGLVKVLDFGLAKVGGDRVATQLADSPTVSLRPTEAGVVLGTAAYMAPEQARGQEVDRRADVWAFGCVFYEMLTGAPPHHGDTSQETMASILRDEPDLSKVPAQARRLLKRCLEKDPQKRLRHVGDVMVLLEEPPSGQQSSAGSLPPAVSRADASPRRNAWIWPVAAGVALALAGIGLFIWGPRRTETDPSPAVRFEVAEAEGMKFFYGGAMAVSPDGRWMVFPAVGADGIGRYWLRSLETVEARALEGTEGAYTPPAWTADSKYVLFTPLGGGLKKVDIQGGPPQSLSNSGGLNGASANRDGVIVYGLAGNQPLFRVPVGGGMPIAVTVRNEGEGGNKFPQFLPDGHRFLYLRVSNDPAIGGVYVGSIDAKPEEQSPMRVLASNRQAYYAAPRGAGPGHLIFLRGTTLMAQPFDPATAALSGEAAPIAENVDSFPAQAYGLFSLSDNGTLVYRRAMGSQLAITWFDQKGNPAGALGEPGEFANPALSPDGTRVAVAAGSPGARDVWIIDVARKTNTRLTFDPKNDDNPVWSPDGRSVAFSSNRNGQPRLYLKPADGSSEERQLADQPGAPSNWTRDGRYLLFTSGSPKTGNDIWVLPDPERAPTGAKPFPLLATESNEGGAQVSPDGRWLAYLTNATSFNDIYVRPFSPTPSSDASGAKWLVSRGLAQGSRWRADGKQLVYGTATFDIAAVDVDTSNGFQAGTPRRLFTAPPPFLGVGFTLSADATRFLFVTTPDGGKVAPFNVVVNWPAALRK